MMGMQSDLRVSEEFEMERVEHLEERKDWLTRGGIEAFI